MGCKDKKAEAAGERMTMGGYGWGIHDASEGWWPEMKRSAIKASDLGDSREEMID
jgi:hypothetical protein